MDRATRLVLAPGATYADVSRALAGWAGGSTDHLPELAGEPVSARWTRGRDEVFYSANPVIGLRVLEGSGLEGTGLPAMTTTEAARLAGSDLPEEAMLGSAALRLLTDPTGVAARHLARRRAEHPDRDPVLGLLGGAADRRQVLRGFIADPPADRARRLDVVFAALADADWEVRWSAVVAAHDLDLPETALALRRCPVGDAPDRGQREVLEVLRDVVGHRLTGGRSTRPGVGDVGSALDGAQPGPGPAGLLVTSLRTPLPEPPAEAAPDGWKRVPAVPHWLGGSGAPVRRAIPAAAFLVAAEPVADVGLDDLPSWLARLSADTGRDCRLPTPDELEMAARGSDGRRYPWGNARETGWRRAESPWGLARPLLGPEWVDDASSTQVLAASAGGLGTAPVPGRTASLRVVLSQ